MILNRESYRAQSRKLAKTSDTEAHPTNAAPHGISPLPSNVPPLTPEDACWGGFPLPAAEVDAREVAAEDSARVGTRGTRRGRGTTAQGLTPLPSRRFG